MIERLYLASEVAAEGRPVRNGILDGIVHLDVHWQSVPFVRKCNNSGMFNLCGQRSTKQVQKPVKTKSFQNHLQDMV